VHHSLYTPRHFRDKRRPDERTETDKTPDYSKQRLSRYRKIKKRWQNRCVTKEL
jgi:hypothetical protein